MAANENLTITIRAKNEAEKEFKKMNNSLKSMQANFTKMAVIGTATFIALGIGIGKSISKARDFEEETNKFSVIFREVSVEAKAMANTLNESYGLSRLEATKLLASTGDILTGFGFTGAAALELSGKVNTLAVDLASFTNAQGGAEAVSIALTKALLGERESLKTYGMAILEVDVKAELLIMGMAGLTGEALRQAKAQATLNIAFRQSKNAIGDYARSTGTLTQTQKELKKTIEDVQITIGQLFAPMLNKLLKAIQPIISSMGKWIQKNPELTKNIIIFTIALAGATAIVGLLGLAIIAVTAAMGTFAIATVVITGGIVLLIPLIVLMIANWEKVSLIILTLGSIIKAFGKTMFATGKFILKIVASIVKAFINWKDTLKDIAGAIVKLFKGDFKGAWEDFKNTASDVFEDTINGFAEFGAESERIMQELDNEVMEYANIWEQINVDKRLEDINNQLLKVQENTNGLPPVPATVGGSVDKLAGSFEKLNDKIKDFAQKSKDAIISASNEIKKFQEELSNLKIGNIKENREINQDFANAFVEQERKIAEIRASFGSESDQDRKTELQNQLQFEEGELERFKTIAIAFENEINEVRRRNSLSDIARSVEDLNLKRTNINLEFQEKRDAINKELALELEKINKISAINEIALAEKDKFDAIAEKMTLESINRQIAFYNRLAEAVSRSSSGKQTGEILLPSSIEKRAGATIINNFNGNFTSEELAEEIGDSMVNKLTTAGLNV